MADEEMVQLGESAPIDAEVEELKEIYALGIEYEGEKVLSIYEEDFCKSNYEAIERQGASWDYSESRQEVTEKIRSKLEKHDLL